MSITKYLDYIQNPWSFWGILFVANIIMFLLTIITSYVWSSVYKHKKLPLEKNDIIASILVVFINVIIAIPGYLLFINSKITFTDTNFLRDFIVLFFVVDILMYLFHYASHYIWPFKLFHEAHHEHYNFNEISLYVMHPAEAILFGFVLTIIPYLLPLNLYSFIVFLVFNWLIGVLSHLNTSSNRATIVFGNNVFHKNHHEYSKYNFGFYTVIWDKVFGTYFPKK
ncbi:sterol desaturase family protein [Aquimarina aquimarini]|uniref:sterol desaturase family protein n=1 Tax=Aquimarina aquimarini TaxID=1191734 RepID=UPI000D560B9B|nr:sterol desaturase family protein [Aquimarina aquimarini]